jgi:RNA polymerase sigma-54 factor
VVKIGYEMSLKQVQKLVITPELRQAITILQLPWMELEQYISEEMLENPLLEFKEKDEERGPDSADIQEQDELSPNEAEEKTNHDIDWQLYFEDASDIGYVAPRESRDEPEVSFESFISYVGTFHDYLMFQLHISSLGEDRMKIGALIIGGIDDDGYLRMKISEVAAMAGVSCAEAEKVLGVIQQFDPVGVGARTLEECLLIQLETLKATDSPSGRLELAEKLIKEHLDDVAQGGMVKISEALEVGVLEVQDACDLVRTLDPKPGRQFGGERGPAYIEPDASIERVGGEYVVTVHDVSAPRLSINPLYRKMLSQVDCQQDGAVDYVKSKLNSALWLIRSIEQRRQTLQKVIECIVKFQRDFLDRGVKHLRPLTLEDVAREIGVHESTVSRATQGKYVATPRGTFELKFFFTSGIPTVYGKGASSESVKKMIREIIEGEDPKKPFSDRVISEMLREQGIIISRRTVAKYREEERIAASTLRKRFC